MRDELSIAGDIIFKGSRIVIPKAMRPIILERIHEGHLGIDKCRKRGREATYWPGINNDIAQLVKNCSSCIKYSSKKCQEPLKPHEVPLRPWQKVASDLFHHQKDYLIVTDYFSYYPEIVSLRSTSTKAVVDGLKSIFGRHGVPDTLITDNGPQYSSMEFQQFTKDWSFTHQTVSPHFPSSNGLAESAVKTVKNILKKSMDSNSDVFKALLAYRTTPLQCGKSPAQLLMQRRLKNTLPMHHSLLKVSNGEETVEQKLAQKEKQKQHFDKHSQSLPAMSTGDQVLLYNFHSGLWDTPGRVVQEVSPRSYIVQTDNGIQYRRNRRHITCAPDTQHVEVKNMPDPELDEPEVPVPEVPDNHHGATPSTAGPPRSPVKEPAPVHKNSMPSPKVKMSPPRRSSRATKPVKKLIEEV